MKPILEGAGAIVGGTLMCVAFTFVIGFPIMVVTGNFNPHGAVNGLLYLGAFVAALAFFVWGFQWRG